MVRNVAAALMSVTQFGGQPAIFAVIAGRNQSGPRQPDVFAGGKIGPGRQHVIDFTVQDAIDIYHALGAAACVTQDRRRFMPVIALADSVQRGAPHVDVFTGLRIRSGWLDGDPAFTLGTD